MLELDPQGDDPILEETTHYWTVIKQDGNLLKLARYGGDEWILNTAGAHFVRAVPSEQDMMRETKPFDFEALLPK